MQFTPGYLFGMVLQTIPEPRKVARDLFDLPVARNVRWLVLVLMVVMMISMTFMRIATMVVVFCCFYNAKFTFVIMMWNSRMQ